MRSVPDSLLQELTSPSPSPPPLLPSIASPVRTRDEYYLKLDKEKVGARAKAVSEYISQGK